MSGELHAMQYKISDYQPSQRSFGKRSLAGEQMTFVANQLIMKTNVEETTWRFERRQGPVMFDA